MKALNHVVNKLISYSMRFMFIASVALFTINYSPSTVFAAFLDTGWGVRPEGMGGAFTAVANDSNAPLFNPGGIAQLSKREATFMSSQLFTGLEGVSIGKNYFGYIQPLGPKAGSLSLTWGSLFSPGLYREDTGALSYGRYLRKNIAFGFNIKYLRKEYTLDERTINDPVFASGSSKDAVTFDAGILYFIPKIGVSVGLTSKNITKPDMGLKTQDLVENENVAGIAYYNKTLPWIKLPYFTAAIDYVSRADVVDTRFGIETKLFNGRFPIRLGARTSEVSMGMGYEINFSAGSKLLIDYAFGLPLEVEQTTGSHQIGVSLRF